MASLFLAGSLTAAPLAAPGMSPVAVKPILSGPEAPGAAPGLMHDQVYSAVKELGATADVLAPAMKRIDEQSALGYVDMASINDVTGTIADYDVAMKIEKYLLGYAEAITLGGVVDGVLPELGLEPYVAAIKVQKLGNGVGRLPGNEDLLPRNGGTCLTCPSFDFGTFTPTSTFQFHSESTDTNADCNIYSFNVTNGVSYQFSLCAADGGTASFDTRLTGYNPAAACTVLFDVDDTGCLPNETITYTATYTGTLLLRVKGWQSSVPWAFGSYTLAYRSVNCATCTAPISTLPTPTATCQIATGPVNSTCPFLFWLVQLNAGSTYMFTTCPADCAATSCTNFNDTYLELFLPTSTTCPASAPDRVAFNDDATCTGFSGLRSRFSYTPTISGLFKIKARAFSSGTSGTICMGYVQTSGPSCTNSCASGPFLATITPTAVCQTVSGSVVAPCTDTWYLVNATVAASYEFTTCTAPVCAGGNTAFDSILELYNNACGLVASDNDGCGAPRSNLTWPLTPGTYKLRVRSATGAAGAYTVTYRTLGVACTAPSGLAITPTSGTANGSCQVAQTFNVTASGTAVMTYNWTITPPVGGTAAPASGTALGGAGTTNPGSFTSTLTREGNYNVCVTATNACGSQTACITYQLRDLTAPTFPSFPGNTTVDCSSVPPAPILAAADNCDPNPTESFSQVITPGSCPGRYTITRTWSAVDRSGNSSGPRSQVITVVDTTPPVIVPDTSYKYCLYPPNHEMHCFLQSQFSPVVMDDCSNPVTWKFAGILSSEEAFPTNCGDGNIDPDSVVGPGGLGFCVRSERCGQDPAQNDGRVYLILATATDACGNTSQPTAIGAILVPHDNADTSNCIYP